MEYRQLGKWGINVSALGLGSYLTIGMTCDDDTSRQMVRAAYEAGINYFDTANAYNKGQAEHVLGKCLAEFPRSDLVVLTKVFAPMGDGPNDRGLSAKHIREQCDASLKRLGMDYIDVYMCHRPHPPTPLEETIRAMEDLARAGKILYWSASEWPAALILRANALARELGARPIAVSQPRYNLLYRYPEELLYPTNPRGGHRQRDLLAAGPRHADGQIQARRRGAGRYARVGRPPERRDQGHVLERGKQGEGAGIREHCGRPGRERAPNSPLRGASRAAMCPASFWGLRPWPNSNRT